MSYYLPAPSVPLPRRSQPGADEVAAIAGADLAEPLRRVEEARAGAERLVGALTSCRPPMAGLPAGPTWVEASKLDAADAAEGRQPEGGWRLAALVAGDVARWADAHAAVKALPIIEAGAAADLDRDAIAEAASGKAAEAVTRWVSAAEMGWTGRDDRAGAWQHRRDGESALTEWRAAEQVRSWAERKPLVRRGGPHDRADLSGADALPAEPHGKGWWLALGLWLDEGRATWLTLPQGVAWPADMPDRLIEKVMPNGAKLAGLVTHGVAEPYATEAKPRGHLVGDLTGGQS